MICSCTVLLPTTVSMSFCHNDISVMCVCIPNCGQGLEVYVSVDVSFVVDEVLRGHHILQSLICKAVLTESTESCFNYCVFV